LLHTAASHAHIAVRSRQTDSRQAANAGQACSFCTCTRSYTTVIFSAVCRSFVVGFSTNMRRFGIRMTLAHHTTTQRCVRLRTTTPGTPIPHAPAADELLQASLVPLVLVRCLHPLLIVLTANVHTEAMHAMHPSMVARNRCGACSHKATERQPSAPIHALNPADADGLLRAH
jgi:hypothetical protein